MRFFWMGTYLKKSGNFTPPLFPPRFSFSLLAFRLNCGFVFIIAALKSHIRFTQCKLRDDILVAQGVSPGKRLLKKHKTLQDLAKFSAAADSSRKFVSGAK